MDQSYGGGHYRLSLISVLNLRESYSAIFRALGVCTRSLVYDGNFYR